ncbi:MAG TPA: DUF4097 family beta strand repeat-containing protein [Pyrinomonadaceae bacterium]|nr:DUF4097 family beta strand repeat-containing protein [Pyrinomonadaceae bacterium]
MVKQLSVALLGKSILMLLALMEPVLAQAPIPPLVPEPPQTRERRFGRAEVAVERPLRIAVDNRTTGRIKVTGWDRDEVEARAISDRGEEVVILSVNETGAGKLLYLKADYADLETPGAPAARVLDHPPSFGFRTLQVHLEVNVPRYVELEQIRVIRSDVEVVGVNTSVKVFGNQSTVVLKQVGGAHVFTRSGNIEIENTNGLVEIATSTGAVRVSGSTGAARIVAIAGPVEVKCSRGRIDVANTQGSIELSNVEGDVDAVATTSTVRFTGRLRNGRYLLKSMSGRVEMILPSDTKGFDAVLSSYLGMIETDFPFGVVATAAPDQSERRLAGKFGNGGPQVTLDSFEGLVRLTKSQPEPASICK